MLKMFKKMTKMTPTKKLKMKLLLGVDKLKIILFQTTNNLDDSKQATLDSDFMEELTETDYDVEKLSYKLLIE